MLPRVLKSSDDFGVATEGRSICRSDRRVAETSRRVVRQMCVDRNGENTYGRMFALSRPEKRRVEERAIATMAWTRTAIRSTLSRKCLIGGAAIQWLRDELKLIDTSADSNISRARSGHGRRVSRAAFVGLGAPYWTWTPSVLTGITRGPTAIILSARTRERRVSIRRPDRGDGKDLGNPIRELRLTAGE